MKRILVACALGLPFVGCLDEWGIDDQVFPCRQAGDCVRGFVCDDDRFVCVPADAQASRDSGAPVDTSTATDAGSADAGGVTDAASPD